jgi:polyribonucleotide nucleotidyltransferase
MQQKEYSLEISGRQLTATFTNLADQTNGSVIVKYGQTVVLATAVMSSTKREGIDYFPLTVDYEEKFYAAGLILGGRFIKREGRPSEEAILVGRMVDRTIRPLFESHIRNEIQVVVTVLSIDENNDPDVPSIIAASLALGTSDIPWNGPVSAIRISGNKSSELIINPTYGQREETVFDFLVCGKEGRINMIEAEAQEVTEDKTKEVFEKTIEEIEKIQNWQAGIIKDIGQSKKTIDQEKLPVEAVKLFDDKISPLLKEAVFGPPVNGRINDLRDDWLKILKESIPEANIGPVVEYFETAIDKLVHDAALKDNSRADGRKMDEVRPIYTQAGGLSEVVHGTGIFYRGGTHILTVLTLSGPKDSQIVEGMEVRTKKYFMHHYNFPPFSVGETGRLGGMNRRAIGHGALAEKSLRAVLPKREDFPYTIRLVSEAMASNGSTSMGSICASSLALMDGGVPIKKPVAGIAIGLMSNDQDYRILTDIQGPEDHYGDMDFKIAGTKEGITGIQLDIKIGGIPVNILAEALVKAREARLGIIGKIEEAIANPRDQVLPSAPTIVSIKIPIDKIGTVIGPGGKVIQKITAETVTEIEIEDDGTVFITGKKDGVEKAKKIISDMTREYLAGEKFEGEVTRILDFGAFIKIGHDIEGLVHISEISPARIEKITDVLSIGQKVPVIIKEIDDRGRINLSIKKINPNFVTPPQNQ